MNKGENRQISEKEKVSSWLEKQILIWNGASINKLSDRDRFSHLSPNIKVDRSISEFRVKELDDGKKENSKQEISDNVSKGIKDQGGSSGNNSNSSGSMRLRFKDWSDLHNYLLVSMKQKHVENI